MLRDEKIIENVDRETGPYLRKRWSELADHPLVGEARSAGFLGALELVKDKKKRQKFQPEGKTGALCRDFCFDNGLVMRAVRDAMIISPPLIITKSQIDELISIARKCLDMTAAQLGVA